MVTNVCKNFSSDFKFVIFQTNQLVLWLYPPKDDDADTYPCSIGTHPHDGDVTELKVIQRFVYATASLLGARGASHTFSTSSSLHVELLNAHCFATLFSRMEKGLVTS